MDVQPSRDATGVVHPAHIAAAAPSRHPSVMTPSSNRAHLAIQRQYGRFARAYDRLWAGYLSRSIRLTAEYAQFGVGSRILDVGCGTGLLLEQLGRTHPEAELVGLDLTPRMLGIAQHRLAGRAALVAADAATLPFRDAHFDTVVSSSVLHYLPDPRRALGEWRRVLRPGGRLIVTDWCRDFRTIQALDRVLRRTDRAHGRSLNTSELRILLAETGFADAQVARHRLGWIWGMMSATATAGG